MIHRSRSAAETAVGFARELGAHGDRTAVITADQELTYRDLALRVDAVAERLGGHRRLVLLTGANQLDALIHYLAALAAGHPLLLVPGDSPDSVESLIAAYDPDVVIRPDGDQWAIDERRAVTAHHLHPDLALLLSTSGSTGSPKLVRLSHENVQSNAEAIASYLGISETDRAATSLPLHYCYGLSVVNSHLVRGAGLILTDLSVATPCFWELFRAAGGTTFAGVPYSFDLLDRVGFAEMDLPRLRYVTQAGGRLAPERVRGFAELGRRKGWDLFVMYGQTEATARMAYLPPDLAITRPGTIGRPIPGGSFRLEPVQDGDDSGELVYSGPNVMLGYAESPAALAEGRTSHELRTGDLARRTDDGLYEIVGRRSRFAKVFGLRIDPQQIEAALESHDYPACCLGWDDELVVVAVADDGARVRRLAATAAGLPTRAVRVHVVDSLPRRANSKIDHQAVRELADRHVAQPQKLTGATAPDLCRLYALLLDRPDVTADSSFVSLGGDSLSYVELSVRLEEALGRIPSDWHVRPIRELAEAAPPVETRRHPRTIDTGVMLRAIAIVLIVGTHIQLFQIRGGAHLLLAAAGFNFARFHLTSAVRRERVRHVAATAAKIAVPTMAWVAVALFISEDYDLSNLFLLNSVVHPDDDGPGMHLWFVETLVYLLLLAGLALSVPALDRLERRFSFALPIGIAAAGLLTRYDVLGLDLRNELPSIVTAFWLFALGWAAAKATTVRQRLLVTLAVAATVPGFFPGEPLREALIITGFAALVWIPRLPTLPVLNRLTGLLAGSSLYIYVTHWQTYSVIEPYNGYLALLVALAFGIAYATFATRALRRLKLRIPSRAATPLGRLHHHSSRTQIHMQ